MPECYKLMLMALFGYAKNKSNLELAGIKAAFLMRTKRELSMKSKKFHC